MAKRTNPIKKEHGLAKSTSSYDWLDDSRLRELCPERDSFRRRLIYSIYDWAEQHEALTATDFCITYRIHRKTFYVWLDLYDDVRQAWDQAKLIIANRKLKGALKREYDKEVVFKDLYKYDSEWDEVDKRNAALKKQETPDTTPTVIQLPAAPDTGIQAMKERKEEYAARQD